MSIDSGFVNNFYRQLDIGREEILKLFVGINHKVESEVVLAIGTAAANILATHKLRETFGCYRLHSWYNSVEIKITIHRALQEVGANVNVLWISVALSIDTKIVDVKSLASGAIDERNVINIDITSKIIEIVALYTTLHFHIQSIGRILANEVHLRQIQIMGNKVEIIG